MADEQESSAMIARNVDFIFGSLATRQRRWLLCGGHYDVGCFVGGTIWSVAGGEWRWARGLQVNEARHLVGLFVNGPNPFG